MGIIYICDCCGKNMEPTKGPGYVLRDYEILVNMETILDGLTDKEKCVKHTGCLCPECSAKFFEEFNELTSKYKLGKK